VVIAAVPPRVFIDLLHGHDVRLQLFDERSDPEEVAPDLGRRAQALVHRQGAPRMGHVETQEAESRHQENRNFNPGTMEKMGRPTGFEPATPRITILCSNQLSYGRREGPRKSMSTQLLSNPSLNFVVGKPARVSRRKP
jgi:hypothetical protein